MGTKATLKQPKKHLSCEYEEEEMLKKVEWNADEKAWCAKLGGWKE